MDREGQRALLVRDGDRIGIFTGVDLTRSAVAQRQPLETPVRDLVHWGVVGIDEDSFLFEAALLMARQRVRHLVVRREDEIVGVLDAANVLSSLANQADPIGVLIDRARDAGRARRGQRADRLPDPPAARERHQDRLRHRALDRPAPPRHRQAVPHAGAGGPGRAGLPRRHGQRGPRRVSVKTDQDNGIILADGYQPPDWDEFRQRFTAAMIEAGFPACPGEIMVRNPAWSKPLAGLVRRRARLGADARRAGADERRDLLRRRRRRRRRTLLDQAKQLSVRPAGRGERVPCPLRAGDRAVRHPARLLLDLRHRRRRAQGRARPQEGRHLSADARRPGAGAGAAADRDQHGRAHPPAAGPGRVRQGARRSSSPTPSTSCSACGSRHAPGEDAPAPAARQFRPRRTRSPSSSATCSRTRCRSSSASRRWCGTTSTWRCSEPADAGAASNAPGAATG